MGDSTRIYPEGQMLNLGFAVLFYVNFIGKCLMYITLKRFFNYLFYFLRYRIPKVGKKIEN